MATYELRAMSLGELLDGALTIYRSSFTTLVSIAIICQGIPAIMSTYVALGGGVLVHPMLWFAGIALSAFGGLLAAAATLWVISETYLGQEASLGDSLQFALGKIVPLFIAGLIKYLLIGLACILFIIPGIVVACGYAVVSQIVVLEDAGPTDALGRSWHLTKGFKGKAFALGVIVFLLIYLPFMAFGVLTAIVPTLATTFQIGAQLLMLIIYPVIACAFTLFYYDLRVRKEAFDLEVLSRQLGGEYAVQT